MNENEPGGCALIPDRHIAWMVPLVVTFAAMGAAVMIIPVEPHTVSCEVTLYDSQFEQHVVIGKGEVL